MPAGEVLSTGSLFALNYKDALSASGGPVTRSYPHAPGIDAAGVVTSSTVSSVREGEHPLS
ncbi:MAG: hypothetical protein R2864_13620 [Syntrophotaleaceae bacterium]